MFSIYINTSCIFYHFIYLFLQTYFLFYIGQSVNGHRLLLQILAKVYPEFCVASVPKSASLRNSYQNRPPIGLTLLWAFGQGGISEFTVGMKGKISYNRLSSS